VTSLPFPPVSVTASAMPLPSVITWCLDPVRARSTGLGPVLAPPFSARTCDPSAADRDQSITPAACSLASSTSCSRCHTPASCQSRSRRQHVIPDP
jgi:hypothetical protein